MPTSNWGVRIRAAQPQKNAQTGQLGVVRDAVRLDLIDYTLSSPDGEKRVNLSE